MVINDSPLGSTAVLECLVCFNTEGGVVSDSDYIVNSVVKFPRLSVSDIGLINL